MDPALTQENLRALVQTGGQDDGAGEGEGASAGGDEDSQRFQGIPKGEYDDLPEQAFYMVGGIDEVVEKSKKL